MKKFKIPLILVLIIIVAGCSSLTVKTDYDQNADFKSLKSYRWAKDSEINPDDELQKNPLVQKRIMAGVDKVLSQKGFSLNETGDVDFVVMVHAGIKEKMQVTDWGNRGWYDPWWGPYGGRVDVSHYEEGTLVVDVVHAADKDLIWRGLGTKVIGNVDPDEQEERAYNLVSQIMKDFPPK